MRQLILMATGAMSLALAAGSALATGVRVEPVLLDLSAPAAAGMLALRNEEDVEVAVQTRVFAWRQIDGAETLEPTAAVVASPPIVRLAPGANYTIRVVRTSRDPIVGVENYRVWVDQLPDPRRPSAGGINILIRQSIPVFFQARQVQRANVSWSVRVTDAGLLVTGKNGGDDRLRIASLKLRDGGGRTATFGDGLAGYVLGRSSMTFTVPNPPRGFGANGGVSISAESNAGPVHADAPVQTRP